MQSKASWLTHGERILQYFCNLEKRHYVGKHMARLINKDGNVFTYSIDISKQVKLFLRRRIQKEVLKNVK